MYDKPIQDEFIRPLIDFISTHPMAVVVLIAMAIVTVFCMGDHSNKVRLAVCLGLLLCIGIWVMKYINGFV